MKVNFYYRAGIEVRSISIDFGDRLPESDELDQILCDWLWENADPYWEIEKEEK